MGTLLDGGRLPVARRVYVAASSDPREADRRRRARAAVRAAGAVPVDQAPHGTPAKLTELTDRRLSRLDRAAIARGGMRALLDADVVWMLVPEAASIASYVAFAMVATVRDHRCTHGEARRPIVIASGRPCGRAFAELADIVVETDGDASAWIRRHGTKRTTEGWT